MSRLSIGDYHVGPYCGARVWRPRDWRTYGLFRRIGSGFSIGPVLFWREHIEPWPLSVFATVTTHRGLIIGVTWLGTRLVASPRAHRLLSSSPLWGRLLRKRYLGRAR